jgi:hypothetical protein
LVEAAALSDVSTFEAMLNAVRIAAIVIVVRCGRARTLSVEA